MLRLIFSISRSTRISGSENSGERRDTVEINRENRDNESRVFSGNLSCPQSDES